MLRSNARISVVEDYSRDADALVIRDMGPWNEYPSIEADVRGVVEGLLRSARLKPGQRLLYYDALGELGEILFDEHGFTSFGQKYGRDRL